MILSFDEDHICDSTVCDHVDYYFLSNNYYSYKNNTDYCNSSKDINASQTESNYMTPDNLYDYPKLQLPQPTKSTGCWSSIKKSFQSLRKRLFHRKSTY